MNQNNVWQEYLKAVPELQAPFEAQCRENWVDGTDGPYVIWGMGLMPCILERLAYEEQNKDLLDRTFAFFEKMVYIINRLIKMYKKVYGFYQK